MSRVLQIAAIVAVLVSFAQPAAAQEGFRLGYTDVGATIGIGGLGGASAAFGVRAEHAFRSVPDFGDGLIGIQAGIDYYSWGEFGFKWTYIPISATGNYHFKIENEKLDPFVGVGLGFSIVSCSFSGFDGTCNSSSSLYFIGRAGARYFLSDQFAIYGDVGAGAAALNVGVTMRVK